MLLKTMGRVYKAQWLFSSICLRVSPLSRAERPLRSYLEFVEKLLGVSDKQNITMCVKVQWTIIEQYFQK